MKCVVSLLTDSAYQWWKTLVSVVPRDRVSWGFFQEEFWKKYISQRFIDQKRKEFLELKQGRMMVTKYEREFVRLSKYARECVSTEAILCKRFEDELNEDISLYVGVLKLKEFVVLVDRYCKAEELAKEKRRVEIESRDSRKRQLNKSFQSLSKKSRDFATRSATSADFRSLKRRPHQLLVSAMPDRVDRSTCSRSTHSYICMKLVSIMSMPIESTEFVIRVSNPLGKYVLVDRVCKGCPLMIRGHCFPVDLMLLPFDEFDVILGMDWLATHGVIVNYGRKFIELKCENGDLIRVESDKQDRLSAVISSLLTQKYLRKGYDAYLAFMMNTKETELKIKSVPTVCKYPDVFQEELPRLPPIREIDFGIKLALGTTPISIAPYRMAPTELKELKAQLQELMDKGFARPSYSP
ncbi:Gag protease polyprotein [Gossypium australe]|uniref:Gag protease polyprotein n=1 Tax=Gossypium australe TaxID=47621 RepID=A0A5B6WRH5_9ROSI|nr:Gag protease polyprotein [Gossypium australe]